MRRTIRLCMTAALAASAVVALPAAADSHIETVLTNVDNPRGLTVEGGDLFVAASGRGGAGPCTVGPEGGEVCYGDTGAIHDVRNVAVAAVPLDAGGEILVDNLPSLAGEGGAQASGPADVSVSGGTLYYTIGLGADPAVRDGALEAATNEDMLATLQSAVSADGTGITQVADLGAHEASENPDGSEHPDSNPFGLVAGTDTVTVLDSGGNTMLDVDAITGEIATREVFPPTFVPVPPVLGAPMGINIPAQAVPTQLAMRADGTFDVGQLTGFPFYPGSASVWHVDAEAQVLHTGFTNIMDVAWHDGDLYVLEIAHDGLLNGATGALIRVSTDGDTVARELLMDDLDAPGGIAFDQDAPGTLYMTLGSDGIDGSVVRFDATAVDPLVTVVDDTATTDEDERLVADDDAEADAYQSVTADVAANDEGVTTVSVLHNSAGAVYEGSLVYQPPAHFTGEDEVTYLGCSDDEGSCLIGVLTVTVEETDVDRIAGGTRIQTAIEASQGRYPDGAAAVVIARADLYPDALAGGPLAQVVGGPILLTSREGLDDDVAAEIMRLGADRAYLLGGTLALSDGVEEATEALVPEVARLQGGDRFATAVAIRDELAGMRQGQPPGSPTLGANTDHAYVVEGSDPDPTRGWPDAVSVSALASFEGHPILLVETDRMPEVTANALEGIDATIIGGPVAIGAEVTAAIEEAADAVDRIEGDTRYGTSRLVAERSIAAGMANPFLTLVSGGNWPDALVAGPLVGENQGAFMLVHPTDLAQSPETLQFIDDNGPLADIDLFGGTDAIRPEVAAGVAAANGG